MKLRNFKKSIHRKRNYKYIEPKINNKIFIRVDGSFIYYTCHKLTAKVCLLTKKICYIIK